MDMTPVVNIECLCLPYKYCFLNLCQCTLEKITVSMFLHTCNVYSLSIGSSFYVHKFCECVLDLTLKLWVMAYVIIVWMDL